MDYLWQGLIQALKLLSSGDAQTLSAIWVTVRVSTISIAGSLILGIPCGFLLGYTSFPGKKAIRLIVDTLLSFPTVVIGLLVYAAISRQGPLGEFGLLFTLPGIAIGQIILGLPIIIALTASAVEHMDERLRPTLLTLGANARQVMISTVWEARYAILAAAVTAYGRIVSEVGISMMVGGNIKWHTRTITTAIALETNKGQFGMGIALGLVLLAIAFGVNLVLHILGRKTG
ncbi:ABC transporter permease [Desulfovermiculus halophilus]|jgi:tungstate transport system permease protein|uniref:ABC transporter permease n=1 Tax=Desulfovermiculus halophilus TaxID=339722 RepID=UPI00048196C7|nr:ABC transporter permease [Desulfovermiculus halophilus]